MSTVTGIDVVQGIYDRINAGDPGLFELLDPAIEWVTPRSLPWGLAGHDGRYQGHDELASYFGSFLAHVADGRVDVDALLPAGDRVLAVGWECGTARATGMAFRARCAHLWTIDGGRAVRLDGFPDTAAMCAAFAQDGPTAGAPGRR